MSDTHDQRATRPFIQRVRVGSFYADGSELVEPEDAQEDVIVVPKSALTAALEERDEAKQIIANFTACLEEDPRYVAMRNKAGRAEAALAEALDVIEAVVAGIVTLDGARVVLRKHGRLP